MQATVQDKTKEIQAQILSLLADLPLESMTIVEQFVRFIHSQVEQGQVVGTRIVQEVRLPYLYPTIGVPATVIEGLIGIAPPAGGDALEDSEKIYDDD